MLGENNPDTLLCVGKLAVLLHDRGKHEQAEQMHWRVVWGNEQTMGATHPETLASVSNLAGFYHAQDELQWALDLYDHAIEGYVKVWVFRTHRLLHVKIANCFC